MRVVRAVQFGKPDVLVVEEAPDPEAGPGQAVVGVRVVPLLFLDTQTRRGWGGAWFTIEPPYVPGSGVAGEVISVGEGVNPAWTGRRVVTDTGDQGAYLQRVAVPVENLVAVPEGLGLQEAAALMYDGRTAMRLAELFPVRPGEWVLVLAAAGGLGSLLVQLAHAAGGRVIGAAGGKQKVDLVRELGAEAVVDYTEPGWPGQLRSLTGGEGPEVVFDGAGGRIGREAFDVIAEGGMFSAHGAPGDAFAPIDPEEARSKGVMLSGIEQVQLKGADARRLTALALSEAAAGLIRPVIGRAFPLERAGDAHAELEAREILGRALLLV
ncbi:zinc-binding dehydrogenase [Streptomyces sp. NPDC047108]|uniref:zinc-binding dehydrogenase n=1 Tax=Streptomyces sp. NPDC047108 TaxID=3155025 RepID=UPI0033F9E31F